jgi:TadE-like protein
VRARLGRRGRAHGAEGERGQGLVEFAMLVPVFLLILLGLLEFGFVFDQQMTLAYGTREGARSGAAFGAGNAATMPCAEVDKNIIAAVERVLKGPGSRLTLAPSTRIQIYRATSSGGISGGAVNTWTYTPGTGPSVDGQALDFSASSVAWNACGRKPDGTVGSPPDSIGVSIVYTYRFVTPLSAVVGFFGPNGPSSLQISDKTVMALNPTAQ